MRHSGEWAHSGTEPTCLSPARPRRRDRVPVAPASGGTVDDQAPEEHRRPAPVGFDTGPAEYRHWRLDIEPPLATLTLAVAPEAGLRDDYELKLNSYDLGVDIELHDAVQRLRFEHPDVHVVVLTGGL